MKRCPVCDRTFEDSMKFCQTDGTPLVAASDSADSMKTIVSNPSDSSASSFDSFKTVVGDPLSANEGGNFADNDDSIKTQIMSRDEIEKELGANEFNSEAGRDVSPPSPFGSSTPSWMDAQDEKSSDYRSSSTPFHEPEPPMFGNQQNSFNESSFESQNQSYNQPFQQPEWTPPPAPISEWQNQNLGVNTPFQPPISGQGDDKTLAIVALVCGILSLTCCGAVTGIAALITGNMAKNNIDANPQQYGGRGMALAGMIMGGISLVLTALWLIFVILGGALR